MIIILGVSIKSPLSLSLQTLISKFVKWGKLLREFSIEVMLFLLCRIYTAA